MKIVKALTACVALVLAGISLNAQPINKKKKPTQYIDIDNTPSTDVYYWKLKYNYPYVVRLSNVNRFVYKTVTGDQTGTNLFNTVPTAFSAPKIPSFLTKPILAPHLLTAIDYTEFSKDMKVVFDQKLSSCECVNPNLAIAKDTVSLKNYNELAKLLAELKKTSTSFQSITVIQDSLTALKANIVDNWFTIEKKKAIILALFQTNIENSHQNSLVDGYRNLISKSDSIFRNAEARSKSLSDYLKVPIDVACKKYYDSTRIARSLKCLDSCKNATQYWQLTDSLNKIITCYAKYAAKMDSITSDIAQAKQLILAMKQVDTSGKLLALQKDYDLISETNYNYEMEPFIADKDVHDITIKIQSEEPLVMNKLQANVIKIKGITTGGIKLDFSTGVFFNFGNNDFLGPDYYYKKIDSVNKQVIEAERSKKTMFSIGALAHFYWRMNSFVKPAISLGLSTTTSFETVNFHGGLSLLLSKPGIPSRFILTGGITLREVSLLDKRYQLNTSYPDLPDAVPTSKNFPKTGTFFAITYNLFTPAAK